jgi:hypothetical protein
VNTNHTGVGIEGEVGPSLYPVAPGAGVFGVFDAPSGTGEGVLGFAVNGSGVVAESVGGPYPTLFARNYSASAGPAVRAVSNAIVGITYAGARPDPAAGVLGQDFSDDGGENDGVLGTTVSGAFGVVGRGSHSPHGYASGGVLGEATRGVRVEGFSSNGAGMDGETLSTDYAAIQATTDGTSGFSFVAFNRHTQQIVTDLDSAGNLTLAGRVTASGELITARTATGQTVGAYNPEQTQPTMEDVGEARLVKGYAAVLLDPKFRAAIDRRATYLVFITPQGDSNGLYVEQKGPDGFVVREHGSGQSSIAFDYRVVATPYAVHAPRLPVIGTLFGSGLKAAPLGRGVTPASRARLPGVKSGR